MAIKLSDDFNSSVGQWTDWDSNTPNALGEGFLTDSGQQHIDLRTFQQTDERIPRGQSFTDLLQQADVVPDFIPDTLDDLSQALIESIVGVAGEQWAKTGTGFTSLVVAKDSTRGNWRALKAVTTGAAVSSDFISSIAVDAHSFATVAIDISAMDDLSIIFADWNSFDATSYVQLTSNPTGLFGTAAYDSAQATFTGSLSEERVALVDLVSGAGANFSLAGVTGVKVHIDCAVAPAASLTFSMMAIRAIKSGWTSTTIDFDTREGKLVTAVTLDGNDPAIPMIPLFRGTGSGDDPRPSDATVQVNFQTGSQTIATGGTYNEVNLYFREFDDGTTDSWIRVALHYNGTDTYIVVYIESWDDDGLILTSTQVYSQKLYTDATAESFGSQTGTHALVLTAVDNNPDPVARDFNAGLYQFEGNLSGDVLTVRIWAMTASGSASSQVWPNLFQDNAIEDSTNFTYLQGRVGFLPVFIDRDGAVDGFVVSETGFANLTTKVYSSLTPVDGAQLQAAFSDDLNLFTDFYAPDLFRDPTKTLSGLASYRSAAQVVTNQFEVDDWPNSYVQFDLFVPVSDAGDGWITLFSGSTEYTIDLGPLAANTFHAILIDLDLFRTEATGRFWQMAIGWPLASGGFFWIDGMKIGRRQVSWQVRASSTANYRDFRSLVNDPDGAVHFPIEERGTALQLQAKALTQDAWIAGFVLVPRYAQLGAPLYMQPDRAL